MPEIHEAVKSAHAIVVADVIGRKPVFKNDSLIRNDYVIVIQESLKGFPKKSDTLFIAAPASEIITNMCEAFYYQPGKRYIFYTYLAKTDASNSNLLKTFSCDRNQFENLEEIAEIKEELAPAQTFPVALKRFFRKWF
ncbi:MAG: hypothetical protein V4642_09480 [Bacteroidota bacterium]